MMNPREQEQKEDRFALSISIEKKDDIVEVPISDSNSFQVRTDGVYLDGKLTFWNDIICVLLVPKWDRKGESNGG